MALPRRMRKYIERHVTRKMTGPVTLIFGDRSVSPSGSSSLARWQALPLWFFVSTWARAPDGPQAPRSYWHRLDPPIRRLVLSIQRHSHRLHTEHHRDHRFRLVPAHHRGSANK